MTVVASLLAVGIVCLYFGHQAERARLLNAFERERKSLLDRIQFPSVRQVEGDGETEVAEVPRDAAELQWVGEVVPEFVNVGDQEA